MAENETAAPAADAAKNSAIDEASGTPSVKWDDSGMQTSYANVVNAFSTREEFTLLFGTNQTWSLGRDNELNIKLSDRLILNPLVAKRLHALMGQLLEQYETRYGALPQPGKPSVTMADADPDTAMPADGTRPRDGG